MNRLTVPAAGTTAKAMGSSCGDGKTDGWRKAVLPALAGGIMLATIAPPRAVAASSDIVNAVGIENEYADVIGQVGGQYVQVTSIVSDPNTDPHTFEASPRIAGQLAGAKLVVENGIGYDAWADKILKAAPSAGRHVINVQHLLKLPDGTPNPHLWYDPKTMPVVADAIAARLGALQPAHAAEFNANARTFVASLGPWKKAMGAFKAAHGGTPFAVTEPVGDDLLQAMGGKILTPFSLETAVMNGTDPSPQNVSAQNALFADHAVKVFVYNQQVTDALTKSFLDLAKKNGIPVVGVYETMPTPGFTYQSWMLAEVKAVDQAVTSNVSTEVLAAKP